MKTFILLNFFLFLFSGVSTAQSANAAVSTGCSCKPEQSVCSADALFMSCCTCCQAGSSCGCWSGFGFCGCKCESTTSNASLTSYPKAKFYINRFMDFMKYLDSNQISSTKFRNYSSQAISNKQVIRDKSEDLNYILLEGDDLAVFKDRYVTDMQSLAKNSSIALIIDAYINKK